MHESVFKSALDDWWTEHGTHMDSTHTECCAQEMHSVHHVRLGEDLLGDHLTVDMNLMTPPAMETRHDDGRMAHSTDRDWRHWNWMERSREVFEGAVSEMKHQLSEGVHLMDRRNYLR